MKKIITFVIYTYIVLFCSIAFPVFSQNNLINKQIKDTNGRVIIFQYENGELVKSISTSNGLRNGVMEEIINDTISGDYLKIVYLYEMGVLREECFYSKDSILTDKYVYENGGIKYSLKLIDIDDKKNLHYVKKIFSYCNFMQYNLINDNIIDSIEVKF